MRGWCVLLLIVLAVGFAPAPLPRAERRANKSSQNLILGTWTGNSTIEITHDRLTYHPGPSGMPYELKINTAVQPWTYDLAGVTGTSTAGRTYVGIYRIEGDTLTLHYTSGGSPRPTNFTGPGGFTEVYKRSGR